MPFCLVGSAELPIFAALNINGGQSAPHEHRLTAPRNRRAFFYALTSFPHHSGQTYTHIGGCLSHMTFLLFGTKPVIYV